MKIKTKMIGALLLPVVSILLSTGVAQALPAAECRAMYNDCMDTWYTTQGYCASQYNTCRSTPSK